MKFRWTALAALGSLALGVAEAGTLKVSPIKVFLPADGKSEVIRVKNPDQTPALVQVQAVEWVKAAELDQAALEAQISVLNELPVQQVMTGLSEAYLSPAPGYPLFHVKQGTVLSVV